VSTLGELVSFLIGKGARTIALKKNSKSLENIHSFGKLIL
jgi:hypothetical protein